jgi:regulator of protease activity HflC (stomatin/prohibitin superfamily)
MKNLFIILSVLILTGCTIVGPGERAVRLNFGKASSEVLEPGFHLWFPVILGSATVDVQIQKSEIKTSSASKDMQEIETMIAINWHIESDKVVNLYKTVGGEYYVLNTLLAPAVNEVLKATSAKLTAEEILTKRIEMKHDIDTSLRGRLNSYGIIIDEINIVDLKFSQQFTHAIEAKQIAEQRAKQAHYEALEAEQKAEGEAKAQVTMAKAAAESTLLKANAEAKANLTVSSSLTKDIIEYEKVKNWDGKLPQVTGGSGTLISIPGVK